MTLVDAQRSAHLFSQLPETVQTSGGSAANTAYGLASLGGKAGFIGKIADDAFGRAFGYDMNKVGVGFHPGAISDTEPTGACIIAVTPDGQRSMSTFLGAASLLEPSDISREVVANGSVLFLEGYLIEMLPRMPSVWLLSTHTSRAARCRSRCRIPSVWIDTARTSWT
jgi:sugar/nucleoside kinase (ribokinase family)